MPVKREEKAEKTLKPLPETAAKMQPVTATSFHDLLNRAAQAQEKKPAPKSK